MENNKIVEKFREIISFKDDAERLEFQVDKLRLDIEALLSEQNRKNFLKLVSPEKTNTLERNRERIKNRARIKEEQRRMLKILFRKDKIKNLSNGTSQDTLLQ